MSGLYGIGKAIGSIFGLKDGGAVPPSNAMLRARPRMPQGPRMPPIDANAARALFGKLIARPVPRKHGGAVKKRKAKPKKAKK
jgi:hypothetical protein